jgi:DNA-binding transcriptional LysR family regulator
MEQVDQVGRRLKLRHLHTLEATVQAGSMAKAAAVLSLTQSAISKSIQEMERTLGVPLLDRTTRGIEPTAYGRILLQRSHAMFDELKQGLKEIAFIDDPGSGELNIGITEPMSAVASRVIDRLSRGYRRATFNVLAADTGTLLRELRGRNVELVISRMARPDPDEDLVAETLFTDPLAVVAGKHVRRWGRRKLKLAELREERWILGPPEGFLMGFIKEAFRAEGEDLPRATVNTFSIYVRNSLLANGEFLTIAPRAMLRDPACAPALKALPIELPTTARPIGLITLKRRSLSPLARIFAENTRSVVKQLRRERW